MEFRRVLFRSNAILREMHDEAEAVVRRGAPDAATTEVRTAFMRYVGQGHEITVELPLRMLKAGDGDELRGAFDRAYTGLYGRTIPNMDIEILSWTLTLGTAVAHRHQHRLLRIRDRGQLLAQPLVAVPRQVLRGGGRPPHQGRPQQDGGKRLLHNVDRKKAV